MKAKFKQIEGCQTLVIATESKQEQALLNEFMQKEMREYKHSLQYKHKPCETCHPNDVLKLNFIPTVKQIGKASIRKKIYEQERNTESKKNF